MLYETESQHYELGGYPKPVGKLWEKLLWNFDLHLNNMYEDFSKFIVKLNKR